MSPQNFREYLDELLEDGYSVDHDITGSDPDLIDPGGSPVETRGARSIRTTSGWTARSTSR